MINKIFDFINIYIKKYLKYIYMVLFACCAYLFSVDILLYRRGIDQIISEYKILPFLCVFLWFATRFVVGRQFKSSFNPQIFMKIFELLLLVSSIIWLIGCMYGIWHSSSNLIGGIGGITIMLSTFKSMSKIN